MMFNHHEQFIDVPLEERIYVLPEARQKLFLNLVENYKIFCPALEILYAGLNFDKELKIDYLMIFRVQSNGTWAVLWDAPYAYTNRAIPAYRYVVRNGLHADFFKECLSHFCQISESKFKEFIQSDNCNCLSLNSNDPNYWKHPDNAGYLMKGMSSMGLMYTPSGFKNFHRPDFGSVPADPRILIEYNKKEG